MFRRSFVVSCRAVGNTPKSVHSIYTSCTSYINHLGPLCLIKINTLAVLPFVLHTSELVASLRIGFETARCTLVELSSFNWPIVIHRRFRLTIYSVRRQANIRPVGASDVQKFPLYKFHNQVVLDT